MNWLKRTLGLDKQDEKLEVVTTIAKKLLENESKSNEQLNTKLNGFNDKLETNIANNKVLKEQIHTNLSQFQDTFNAFTKYNSQQLVIVKTEVNKIVEEVLPKPFNPNYSLVDPIDISKTLFSFEITKLPIQNKKKINANTQSFLQILGGTMPNLIGNGLLTNSYRFVFPSGVSGKVMQMANGQGTAIMQSGGIVKHGAYVSNFMTAAPLLVFNIGSMIIQQHYLAKINENLSQINLKVSQLLELEFIKKHAKIESIIYFLESAQNDFLLIETNKEYRSAILANLVRTNIEIFELIQFYKKSFKFIDKEQTSDYELNFKYFVSLHTLFAQGKLLELKYASEYTDLMIANLKSSFDELNEQSIQFLGDNKNELNRQIKIADNDRSWYDWWIGKKALKAEKVKNLNTSNTLIDNIISIQKDDAENLISDLEQFRIVLSKKQEFIIEDGELYEVLE